jgi:hypothetical protein
MHHDLTPRQLRLRTRPRSVAFSPLEEAAVLRAVERTGDTISGFIRAATLDAASRTLQPPETARAA